MVAEIPVALKLINGSAVTLFPLQVLRNLLTDKLINLYFSDVTFGGHVRAKTITFELLKKVCGFYFSAAPICNFCRLLAFCIL